MGRNTDETEKEWRMNVHRLEYFLVLKDAEHLKVQWGKCFLFLWLGKTYSAKYYLNRIIICTFVRSRNTSLKNHHAEKEVNNTDVLIVARNTSHPSLRIWEHMLTICVFILCHIFMNGIFCRCVPRELTGECSPRFKIMGTELNPKKYLQLIRHLRLRTISQYVVLSYICLYKHNYSN